MTKFSMHEIDYDYQAVLAGLDFPFHAEGVCVRGVMSFACKCL